MRTRGRLFIFYTPSLSRLFINSAAELNADHLCARDAGDALVLAAELTAQSSERNREYVINKTRDAARACVGEWDESRPFADAKINDYTYLSGLTPFSRVYSDALSRLLIRGHIPFVCWW